MCTEFFGDTKKNLNKEQDMSAGRILSFLLLLFFFQLVIGCAPAAQKTSTVMPGVDVLLAEKLDLIKGKRVGLITNPTGVTATLQSTIDVLHRQPDVRLVALFGPEHGVRGDVEAGKRVASYTDEKTGVPVYSLYGKTRKPTSEMLREVDVLIYDIQDIGSRAYTYIYTLALAMQSAKEKDIPFIVLDRPNPLGGDLVEGPVLDVRFKSFIGMYPIPYIYGMTVGELARLFNEEFDIHCNLTVVPMRGWRRSMAFSNTGLEWVPTSPHVPHAKTAFFVAAVGCIGELHSVNEGVGYTLPFELIGAPWIDADDLARELNSRRLPGVHFRPVHYRPYYFSFQGQQLQGVQIHLLDAKTFRPMRIQIHILTALKKLYPGQNIFNTDRIQSFYRAIGTDKVQKAIEAGKNADEIIAEWQPELQAFMKIRQKYLIYE